MGNLRNNVWLGDGDPVLPPGKQRFHGVPAGSALHTWLSYSWVASPVGDPGWESPWDRPPSGRVRTLW